MLLVLIPVIVFHITPGEEVTVSEFDTYGIQNNIIIKNQRETIKELENIISELKEQNRSLSDNFSLLSNILITNINYIQNLEIQNANLNRTLDKMNEIQDRTSKELRNLRQETERLRNAIRDLSEKIDTPRQRDAR